jgi:hypothetical protein
MHTPNQLVTPLTIFRVVFGFKRLLQKRVHKNFNRNFPGLYKLVLIPNFNPIQMKKLLPLFTVFLLFAAQFVKVQYSTGTAVITWQIAITGLVTVLLCGLLAAIREATLNCSTAFDTARYNSMYNKATLNKQGAALCANSTRMCWGIKS